MSAGDRLPSLREAGRRLGVSYATISHVYRDLARDGFVKSQPGRGTFVADMAKLSGMGGLETRRGNLVRLVEVFVGQASLLSFSHNEIRGAVSDYLGDWEGKEEAHLMALVGMAENATGSYAREIERLLSALNVRVRPVLLGELLDSPEKTALQIRDAKLVATIPTSLQQVRDLLLPRGFLVSAIAFQPSRTTRRRFAAVAPDCRVGVVASEPKYVQTLVQEVTSYVSSGWDMPYATRDDEGAIRDLLSQIDVVVYHSGCERILEWVPVGVEAIEFLYAPVPESVLSLVPLLYSVKRNN